MFPFDYFMVPALPDSFRAQTASGMPLLVRHVRPEDGPRLQEGFKRISALARRRHFPAEDVKELGEEQLKLLTKVDQKNYVIWGALNPARLDEPGVGIARYQRIGGEPDAADVAITVLEQYQGTGAGLLLHACLHATARSNGIQWLYYDVDGENQRFIRHLRNLGAEHVGRVVGVTRMKLPVYARAILVPKHTASGWKFAQTLRRLAEAKPLAAAAA